MKTESNSYILGTDREELHRLGIQHQVWASEAHNGWTTAGFSRGHKIIDLGSGPGFCSKELAYIVGNEGKVTAIDKSENYIQYLKAVSQLHHLNIEAICSDFSEMSLSRNQYDGMYCRWALAWLSDPKSILTKVMDALKPGGKIVIHEYYHWLTHQINPYRPNLQKAIRGCYESFQDFDGDIDIGKQLSPLLKEIGMNVVSTRSMSKFATPRDFTWQWPRSFYEVYWPKIKAMGYLTEKELSSAFQELEEVEKTQGTTLLCPLLVEIIAEKPA